MNVECKGSYRGLLPYRLLLSEESNASLPLPIRQSGTWFAQTTVSGEPSHVGFSCRSKVVFLCTKDKQSQRRINKNLVLLLNPSKVTRDYKWSHWGFVPPNSFCFIPKTRCTSKSINPVNWDETWQFLRFKQSWSQLSHFLFIWRHLISVNPQAACSRSDSLSELHLHNRGPAGWRIKCWMAVNKKVLPSSTCLPS